MNRYFTLAIGRVRDGGLRISTLLTENGAQRLVLVNP
jgi:hypothetical protein